MAIKSQMKSDGVNRSLTKPEVTEQAPAGWAGVQESIADASGISLLLVDGYQPPALTIANNNSICQALQSSPSHVELCDPYCGMAHQRCTSANTIVHYRCHAGLHCFAMPVQIGEVQNLAVIGGRAFVKSSDYRELVERFRAGDLRELESEEVFRNIIFAEEADLDHAALSVARAAEKLTAQDRVAELEHLKNKPSSTEESNRAQPPRPTLDVRERAYIADKIRRFAERIDASDPTQTYQAIVHESTVLLKAERGSLLLFDDTANSLTMIAACGLPAAIKEVEPIPLGEGIAGVVIDQGKPLVASIDELGRLSSPQRRYKTRSFISYPITIGPRKIGVLNLADKLGGGDYNADDLNLVDLVAPQIALALERADWQQRASQFQLMSITDPLTGLHNRRYQEARLAEELSRSKRYDYPLSFMMIDIDDFKFYNDHHGHQAGDRALEITAQCLKSALRKVDVASRYGGEEFSILLPQTTLEEAGAIADRIRRKIMGTRFPHASSQPLGTVTVSIGLSSFSSELDSAEAIVRAADRALYHAKRHGKNRAYAYGPMARS